MMKAQLAIEIGFDKIRTSVGIEKAVYNAPIGSMSSPYAFPPIGLKSHSGYIFGEIAKLCAVSFPDDIVFLYDYLRQKSISREALISFIEHIKGKIQELYKVEVETISLLTPPYFKDLVQSRFLDSCVSAVAKINVIKNTSICFSRTFLNLNVGERVLFLDFRDHPAYFSLILRGSHSYESIGSLPIEDFSTINCENFVEDVILSNYNTQLFSEDEIMTAWIQGDIASKISQYAIQELWMGKNVNYNIPFAFKDIEITQSDFQNWLMPKLDTVCNRIMEFMRDSGLTIQEVSNVVMLGGIFESSLIRQRVERYLKGYSQHIKYSYFSSPMDEWKICESVLFNNSYSDYALEL